MRATSSGGEWRTFDRRPELGKIACPTLILTGEHDVVFPEACTQSLERGIRADLVRVERLSGCGHALLNDAPERVCSSVTAFLERWSR